jgi:hypothetical protein
VFFKTVKYRFNFLVSKKELGIKEKQIGISKKNKACRIGVSFSRRLLEKKECSTTIQKGMVRKNVDHVTVGFFLCAKWYKAVFNRIKIRIPEDKLSLKRGNVNSNGIKNRKSFSVKVFIQAHFLI